tara:strand:+ start:104 stop:211 length:108 start_codon:yes stop_codon:yes gene_type:complete
MSKTLKFTKIAKLMKAKGKTDIFNKVLLIANAPKN